MFHVNTNKKHSRFIFIYYINIIVWFHESVLLTGRVVKQGTPLVSDSRWCRNVNERKMKQGQQP